MGKSRIKCKLVKSTLGDKDVVGMFNDLLGASEGSVNIQVVYPKYKELRKLVRMYVRIFASMAGSQCLIKLERDNDENSSLSMVNAYADRLTTDYFEIFDLPNFDSYIQLDNTLKIDEIPEEERMEFNSKYIALKKCNLMNIIIMTCKNLIVHRAYIENMDTLKDRFLIKTAGTMFKPFIGSDLNFKALYIDRKLSSSDRYFLMLILHKSFEISYAIYNLNSSPDVDVSKFVQVVVANLSEVKKHIPRCDEAFNAIANSVNLLENNFDSYYKDFVASSNPVVIMENFILDVSNKTKASTKITSQFRKIIRHYRQIAQQQHGNDNPQLKAIFSHVDKSFIELDRRTKNATLPDDENENVNENENGNEQSSAEKEGSVLVESNVHNECVESNVHNECVEPMTKSQKKRRSRKHREIRKYLNEAITDSGELIAPINGNMSTVADSKLPAPDPQSSQN